MQIDINYMKNRYQLHENYVKIVINYMKIQ